MKIPKCYKRGDMWSCQLMVDGQRRYVSAADEATCLAKAMELRAGLRQLPDTDRTLAQAMDAYINRKSNVLSPSTIRGYRIIYRNRFLDLQRKPVKKITHKVLQAAINAEADKVSAKTLKNATALVVSAILEETGTRLNVTTPAAPVKEHPFLVPDQIPIFLEAIKDTDIEIACLLGLWSLRRSELLALRWEDVDLYRRLVHVNGAYVPDENNQYQRKDTTKNASSTRAVPMCQRLYELLKAKKNKMLPSRPVVTINPNTLRNRINALCREHGLPAVGIHGLRHSFVSVGYMANVPIHVLMEIGGWANDATLKKHYLHIAQADKKHYQDVILKLFDDKAS